MLYQWRSSVSGLILKAYMNFACFFVLCLFSFFCFLFSFSSFVLLLCLHLTLLILLLPLLCPLLLLELFLKIFKGSGPDRAPWA